jgi:hypothetical protein
MEMTMVKSCFCAVATLIGALIGASAPAEWRSDSARYARTAALANELKPADLAIVYRPY